MGLQALKRGFCKKCAFQFNIADLNKFDENVYTCPMCREQNDLSEIYIFEAS